MDSVVARSAFWVAAIVATASLVDSQCIITVAGPLSIDGSPATTQQISAAYSAVADPANGGYIVSDNGGQTLRRIWPNGTMTTITGIWRNGGLAADRAVLGNTTLVNTPSGIISDGGGGFFFADKGNALVWRLQSNATLRRFAGNTTSRFIPGSAGDGIATAVSLVGPTGLALDSSNGGVWICDTSGHVVRFVGTDGVMTRLVGTGSSGYTGDNGLALAAQLSGPLGVLADGSGGVFISDTNNNVIRRMWSNNTIVTIAGNTSSFYFGDNIPAARAVLATPTGLASDNAGGIIFADSNNCVIRRITSAGLILLVAGTPRACAYLGDGVLGTSARFGNGIRDINPDLDGTGIVIGDLGTNTIRRLSAGGILTTLAGVGLGFAGNSQPNGPGTSARLFKPWVVLPESSSSLVILDNGNHVLRRFFTNNYTMGTVVAGTIGTSGFSGDGGAASSARMNNPSGLASAANAPDGLGGWLISDLSNNRIRRVFANLTIATVCGNGTAGIGGDGLPGTMTALNGPAGVSEFDPAGTFYVSDTMNRVVRRIFQNGTAAIVAGVLGVSGSAAGLLNFPRAISLIGNDVLISDSGQHAVRILYANSTLSSIFGVVGASAYSGDGGLATLAKLNNEYAAVSDGSGGLLISDFSNNVIRRRSPSGMAMTAVFRGNGYNGDGGPPADARSGNPTYVYVDGNTTWITEFNNHALRRVLPRDQCIPPNPAQLTGCIGPVASGFSCNFSGLAMVPPMFAWLGTSSCTTTQHPGPQNGGTASVACRLDNQSYFSGTITWISQLGTTSASVVLGTASQSGSLSVTQSMTQSSSLTLSPSATGSVTSSQMNSLILSWTSTATGSTTQLSSMAMLSSQTGTVTASQQVTLTASPTASQATTCSSTQTRSPSQIATPTQATTPGGTISQASTVSSTSTLAGSLTASSSSSKTGSQWVSSPASSSTATTSQGMTRSQVSSRGSSLSSTPTLTQMSSATSSHAFAPSETLSSSCTQSESSAQTSSQTCSGVLITASFSTSLSPPSSPSASEAATSASQTATPSLLSSTASLAMSSSISASKTVIGSTSALVDVLLSVSGSPALAPSATSSVSAAPSSSISVSNSTSIAATSTAMAVGSMAAASVSVTASRTLVISLSPSATATPRSASGSLTSVSVDFGVTITGSTFSSNIITSADVLFPLRLGFACAVEVPLHDVAVVDVSSIVARTVVSFYPINSTDEANTRTAPCLPFVNSARHLQMSNEGMYTDNALRGYSVAPHAAPRAAYVATSGTATANGTYVVVHLSVSVAVSVASVTGAAGNVSAIPDVARVVAAVAQLLPTSSSSATASSAILGTVYGPFLKAVAAAAGVNASALAIGSTGAPTAAVASSGSIATTPGSSSNAGLSGGAIAGLVIAVIFLVCLVLAGYFFYARSGREAAKSEDVVRADEGFPMQTNPLRARDARAHPPAPSSNRADGLKSVPHPGGPLGSDSSGDTLPIVQSPMHRDHRSTH